MLYSNLKGEGAVGMRRGKMKGIKGVYYVLLVYGSAIVLAVSLVFAVIYHSVTLRKNETVYALELRNSMAKTEEMMRSAREVAQQVAYDSVAYAMIRFRTLPVTSYMQSLMQLRRYMNINSSIHSIYLYQAKSQDVFVCGNIFRQAEYTTADLPDAGFMDLLSLNILTDSYRPIARTIPSDNPNYGRSETDVFTFLFSLAPAGSFAQHDTVAVNFGQEALLSYVPGEVSGSLMVYASREGELQYASCDKALGLAIAQAAAQRDQEGKASQGWRATFAGGEYYLVTHWDEALGWMAVLAVPYEMIGAESRQVLCYSLLICGLLILLAWGISFAAGHRIYRRSGLERMQEMEEKSERYHRMLRHQSLCALLSGRQMGEEAELEQQFAEHGIEMQAGAKAFMIGMRIDHWREFLAERGMEGQHEMERRALEHFRTGAPGLWESVTIEPGEIVFLYQNPEGGSADLPALCAQVQQAFASEVSLSMMVDTDGRPLIEAGFVYPALSEALFVHRLYHGHGALARLEDCWIGEKLYPKREEKAMIEGLKLADFESVRENFDAFLEKIAHEGLHYISLALVQLNLKLDEAIDTVVRNNKLSVPPKTFDIYIHLDQVELIGEIRSQFCRAFDALEAALEGNRASRQKQLGEAIAAYIETHYQEADLSRQQICEVMHVPYTTAGTAFKALCNGGISAYIVEVRLRHACEQLTTTGNPIEYIASACGFASAVYFHRVFKKKYGVTPGEYRRQTDGETVVSP